MTGHLTPLTIIALTALGLSARTSMAFDPPPATAPIVRFAVDQDYFPGQQTINRVAEDFVLAHKLSVGIIRSGIGWDDTNPKPDRYRWTFWKSVIDRARTAGIEFRPYYAYTPPWAGPAYNSPPTSDREFADACSHMAAAIGPLVPSLEIWNEPDNVAFWNGSPKAYGNLLRRCTSAIRQADPRATVVLGGLVYLDSTWLDRTEDRAPGSYDVSSFHQYSETPWNPVTVEKITSPSDFWGGYDRLSQGRSIPVWMDEGGASTNEGQGYSEETQASWIRRTVASLLGQPGRQIALFGLYQLRDPDPKYARPIGDGAARKFFMHTGIFTLDGRPKLGATTYADLVRLFDNHRPQIQTGVRYDLASGRTSADFRLYAWRLEDGRQIVILWDRHASSAGAVTLSVAGRKALLHQPDGAIRALKHFNGRAIPIQSLDAGAMPLVYEIL